VDGGCDGVERVDVLFDDVVAFGLLRLGAGGDGGQFGLELLYRRLIDVCGVRCPDGQWEGRSGTLKSRASIRGSGWTPFVKCGESSRGTLPWKANE
jgi:hypothetical protein